MILAGLGNTTCPNGRDLKFRMAPREYVDGEYLNVEISGYFGQAFPPKHKLYIKLIPVLLSILSVFLLI